MADLNLKGSTFFWDTLYIKKSICWQYMDGSKYEIYFSSWNYYYAEIIIMLKLLLRTQSS